MKIKHWQGYGCVTAKKVSETLNKDPFYGDTKTMLIRVSGNHECGIERNDKYDVFNWLLKRFDKTATSYRQIKDIRTDCRIENGTDVCDYFITYHLAEGGAWPCLTKMTAT